jgi:putative NADH-flavin reductase
MRIVPAPPSAIQAPLFAATDRRRPATTATEGDKALSQITVSMPIALIGASGNVGSHVLKELSERGYQVTAIARHPEKIAKLPNVAPVKGKFRLGQDQLLANEKGSSISFADYAIAMVDEVAKPAHSRKRFTVGY